MKCPLCQGAGTITRPGRRIPSVRAHIESVSATTEPKPEARIEPLRASERKWSKLHDQMVVAIGVGIEASRELFPEPTYLDGLTREQIFEMIDGMGVESDEASLCLVLWDLLEVQMAKSARDDSGAATYSLTERGQAQLKSVEGEVWKGLCDGRDDG